MDWLLKAKQLSGISIVMFDYVSLNRNNIFIAMIVALQMMQHFVESALT